MRRKLILHEIHFYEGSYEGRQIVLVTCGVGKVNAGHTAQLLIDKFAVDKVINVGVAGGIQPDVHVGDVVIGVSSTTYDVGPSIMGRYFPFVSNYEYDPEVIEAAKAACESITDRSWKYVVRPTITGDMFITDSMLKEKLLSPFPDAACIDMEAQAMAQIARIYGVPIANIRSISDKRMMRRPTPTRRMRPLPLRLPALSCSKPSSACLLNFSKIRKKRGVFRVFIVRPTPRAQG